jgi:hypothetical protein
MGGDFHPSAKVCLPTRIRFLDGLLQGQLQVCKSCFMINIGLQFLDDIFLQNINLSQTFLAKMEIHKICPTDSFWESQESIWK